MYLFPFGSSEVASKNTITASDSQKITDGDISSGHFISCSFSGITYSTNIRKYSIFDKLRIQDILIHIYSKM